jgi:signal transduction histidine kinase/ActR/RegA family two-component response regulator
MSLHDYRRIQQCLTSVADPAELLMSLFAHAPVALAVWTADGKLVLTNTAFVHIFQVEQGPDYDVLADELLPGNGLPAWFERARQGETVHAPTFWYERREQTASAGDDASRIAISMTIFPLLDAGGGVAHVAATFEDKTEFTQVMDRLELNETRFQHESVGRERAEVALRETEEQLRQSQKMEAIGSLAGSIAHDFNNILSIVLGYAETALEELKAGDPVRADVEQIATAGERARDLTRQLLAFSRQQVLEPKLLNLNEAFSAMMQMLKRLVGEDIELSFHPGADLGAVRVDPSQIEQVLLNLVVNARDAMPDGGKLTVETCNIELDRGYAEAHYGIQPGPYVLLAVSDTGIGMDNATRARIFEPFFTTKEKGKGTGLGLSTVFGIVKQSGGAVWVYSEPGHGTTFRVYLPRLAAAPNVLQQNARPAARTRGSETVLLVEDDTQVRALVSTTLRKNGYRVLEAGNGTEALAVAEQHGGAIDVLLSDVVMPGMGGRQLWERLVPRRPKMKVLFMSGYTTDAIVHHGVEKSELAFIPKPIVPRTLLLKLRQVLGSPAVVKPPR